MTDEPNKFTHIGVLTDTQKMIGILARVANGGQGMNIYSLVDAWAKDAWEEAKAAGFVTDAMLTPPAHWVAPTISTTKKRRVQRVGRDF